MWMGETQADARQATQAVSDTREDARHGEAWRSCEDGEDILQQRRKGGANLASGLAIHGLAMDRVE